MSGGFGRLATGRVLDLFCGAGGISMGWHRAGWEVSGIDHARQPRYPFAFTRADVTSITASDLRAMDCDVIVASPPCKGHGALEPFADESHVNLIPQTRALLNEWGGPWVIENVAGAPLHNPVQYCGTAFRLGVMRHRWFECGGGITLGSPGCHHHIWDEPDWPRYPIKRYHSGKPIVSWSPVVGVYGRGQGLGQGEINLWRKAMGIDWMVREELSQAIPPAYSEHIAAQVNQQMAALRMMRSDAS